MTRIGKILGAAALALAAGCGGSGSTGSSDNPPVDGNLQITAASDTDKMNLCNWYTGMVGGYGSTASCSLAFLKPPPSEADCVTHFPSCAVPVSTFEACVRIVIAAQATCTQASMAMAQQDPNCVAVGQAGCFN